MNCEYRKEAKKWLKGKVRLLRLHIEDAEELYRGGAYKEEKEYIAMLKSKESAFLLVLQEFYREEASP